MARKEFQTADQVRKTLIDYWIDLIGEDLDCFSDISNVRGLIKEMRDRDKLKILSIEDTGVFAYVIAPDFLGGRCLSEIIFYIRKEKRGNIRLVKRYITMIEELAKRNHCNSVKIGANTGYNDQGFLMLLKRWGYVEDTVCKYLTDSI